MFIRFVCPVFFAFLFTGVNVVFNTLPSIAVPPTFDMSDPDAEKIDFNIIEGDRIVLPCAVNGDPPPLITWYKDESPISLTDYHYFQLENGSLEIFTADETDTGTYRCAASNIAGDIEKIINLFVQGRIELS